MDTQVRKETLLMTDTPFVYADHLGPKSIHHFPEPTTGLKAILVAAALRPTSRWTRASAWLAR